MAYQKLTPDKIFFIDDVLQSDAEGKSWFHKFKEYPGSATITLLQAYLAKYKKLIEIDFSSVVEGYLPHDFIKHLHKQTRYYDAYAIKRFKPIKRYIYMAAFLYETKKVLTDYIIQMHDQYISNICRECKHIYEDQLKRSRIQYDKSVEQLKTVANYLIAHDESKPLIASKLFKETTSKKELSGALEIMSKYNIMDQRGHLSRNLRFRL